MLVINNLRHTILSRLLNREGEIFKSNTGLFVNASFLPAALTVKLGHSCQAWKAGWRTGGQVHRHSLTAQYNKNYNLRLETCCAKYTHRRTK